MGRSSSRSSSTSVMVMVLVQAVLMDLCFPVAYSQHLMCLLLQCHAPRKPNTAAPGAKQLEDQHLVLIHWLRTHKQRTAADVQGGLPASWLRHEQVAQPT
jgi:hypothetical protein